MAIDQAKHFRIIDPDVGDDFVERRSAAVKDLGAKFKRQPGLNHQLALASSVVGWFGGSELSGPTRELVVAAIKKAAPSFVTGSGDANEVGVVAALAAASALLKPTEANQRQVGVLGVALGLGLTHQNAHADPKIEELRSDLANAALQSGAQDAVRARRRADIPEVVDTSNYLASFANLSKNVQLDQEELDLLWWVVGDWSIIADRSISKAPPTISCILSGIELSGLLKASAARAHGHIALRNLSDPHAVRSASQLAAESADIRATVRGALARGIEIVESHASVFPALAISSMASLDPDASLPNGISPQTSMPLSGWCRRIVEEASLFRAMGGMIELGTER